MAVADDVFLEAVKSSHVPAVEALLEQDADINAPDGRGQTPLIAAASFGSLEAVRVLLTHGADASRQDNHGQTALMAAHTHPEVLALLKEVGPN